MIETESSRNLTTNSIVTNAGGSSGGWFPGGGFPGGDSQEAVGDGSQAARMVINESLSIKQIELLTC